MKNLVGLALFLISSIALATTFPVDNLTANTATIGALGATTPGTGSFTSIYGTSATISGPLSVTTPNPSLDYKPSATGGVSTSYATLFGSVENVVSFGADPSGSADSSTAFQDAINALPSAGGEIVVPPGSYNLSTTPSIGTKSVFWNISVGASFSGSGTGPGIFPVAASNSGIVAVGPFVESQSSTLSSAGNATAAALFEAKQPATLAGGVIGAYAGAQLNSNASNSIATGLNAMGEATSGSSGNVWGIESDLNLYTNSGTQFGISVNGVGTYNPTYGIKIDRLDSSLWQYGLQINKSIVGIQVDNSSGLQNAFIAGSPTVYSGQTMELTPLANAPGDNALFLQPVTDTSPAGFLINAVNKANTTQFFYVSAAGVTYAGDFNSGVMASSGPMRSGVTTVGGLATLDSSPVQGDRLAVTDATTCTFNSPVTGGGSAFCPVIYNGSAWVGG